MKNEILHVEDLSGCPLCGYGYLRKLVTDAVFCNNCKISFYDTQQGIEYYKQEVANEGNSNN